MTSRRFTWPDLALRVRANALLWEKRIRRVLVEKFPQPRVCAKYQTSPLLVRLDGGENARPEGDEEELRRVRWNGMYTNRRA